MSTHPGHWQQITAIWCCPPGPGAAITNTMFINHFTDYLTKWMGSSRNIIICGDFNMHIDDLTDIDAQIFNDTMEALGLQHKISMKIDEYGSDSKKLFQLVNHLTGCKPENPLPTTNTNKL